MPGGGQVETQNVLSPFLPFSLRGCLGLSPELEFWLVQRPASLNDPVSALPPLALGFYAQLAMWALGSELKSQWL